VDSINHSEERWSDLVSEVRQVIPATREVVQGYGQDGDRERLTQLESEIERAIGEERVDLLEARLNDLRELGTEVIIQQPDFWKGYLQHLQEKRDCMQDEDTADRLFLRAQWAVSNDDLNALKAAVGQLIELLPEDEGEAKGPS